MNDADFPQQAASRVIEWLQEQPKEELEKSEEQQQEEASHALFFDEAAMRVQHWDSMAAIDPLQAAMLFSYFNPNEITEDVFLRPETHQQGGPSIEKSSERHQELLQQLESMQKVDPTPRTLRHWWQAVKDKQLKHHPWIEGYMNAVPKPPGAPSDIEHEPTTVWEPLEEKQSPTSRIAAVKPVLTHGTATETDKHKSEPVRRLAALRAMGGDITYERHGWKIRGISELVKQEKLNHRQRCSEKTIRDDLKSAAEDEREARRAGHFDGLQSR